MCQLHRGGNALRRNPYTADGLWQSSRHRHVALLFWKRHREKRTRRSNPLLALLHDLVRSQRRQFKKQKAG
jgi:hypothetical protein